MSGLFGSVMSEVRAPSWLPYRVRRAWDKARVDRALFGIDEAPPARAYPSSDADAEIHMLVCDRDVSLCLTSLRSLLRFEGVRFAVTLTEDGSLCRSDRDRIESQVRGCRWLPPISDDQRVAGALEGRPLLRELYRGPFALARKLVHPVVLASSDRVILLDADTAFFRRPCRLIDWALGDGEHAWYLHDQRDELKAVPAEARHAFGELREWIAGPSGTWRLGHYLFNSGLLAFRPSLIDLDAVERFLAWRDAAKPAYRDGICGLCWFGDWVIEQTSYLVAFAKMSPPAQPLGPDYVLGAGTRATFNHFLWLHLVRPGALRRLGGLVRELRCGPGAS